MARELRDTLAQGLAGLILQLEAADAYITDDPSKKAQDTIRPVMSRVRARIIRCS